jgi:FlaA1/EpsC-like NDP-sugar epimerase
MKKRFFLFKAFTDKILQHKSIRTLLIFIVFSCLLIVNFLISNYIVSPKAVIITKQLGLIVILSQLMFAYAFKINRGIWKYSSISDLGLIFKAVLVSFVFNLIIDFIIVGNGQIVRMLFVDHMLFILSFGGLRLLVRLYKNVTPIPHDVKRVLIIGAGDGGDTACRRLKRETMVYKIVGFLDDDVRKKNHDIHGVKVLGTTRNIVNIVNAFEVDEVVIAIPSAGPALIRDLATRCFEATVQVKIMSSLSELSENGATIELRNLKLEDLLAREPIIEDLSPVRQTYHGKQVMITGAAGSIGEELVRQVAQLKPKTIYLVDQAESPLYFLFRECQVKFPSVTFVPTLCDITDRIAINKVFEDSKPQIVLHAAAYKHVPLLEENLYQAISVNVEGSKILAELSKKHKVERFVFVSTDKAVNPTNILGVTKRMAELLCKVFQEESSYTKFIAVRFGNVIGSQGSVIPLFTKQIEQGGPVTVTHPEIKRYFMMIPEAVQLVLFASVLGEGGETFVLDMGNQVKILDLAYNMIRLCGFEPNKDIAVEFCDLRPGEKLYEELYDETEKVCSTKHPKINMAIGKAQDKHELFANIDACIKRAKNGEQKEDMYDLLKEIVSTYQLDSVSDDKSYEPKIAV